MFQIQQGPQVRQTSTQQNGAICSRRYLRFIYGSARISGNSGNRRQSTRLHTFDTDWQSRPDVTCAAKEFLAKQAELPSNVFLVTDPDYKVTNQYGLRWDAPHETAYPSTFVLDMKGVIVFEKISHTHGDRLSAQEAEEHLSSK